MKTTVEISDPLFEAARTEAQRTGSTLRDLIETGLRKVLDERRRARSQPFRLRDGSVRGQGPHPGVRIDDGGALAAYARMGTPGHPDTNRRNARDARRGRAVIAIDTQLLVYAHRSDSPWHVAARDRIAELANSGTQWAIALPCLVESHAVVTRTGLYRPPSTTVQAIDQIDIWLEAPSLSILSEDIQTWSVTRDLILSGSIAGPRVHDARIAAVCLQHGVTELWTHDRDLSRFPTLRTRNPLIELPTRASEPRAAYGKNRATPARRGPSAR